MDEFQKLLQTAGLQNRGAAERASGKPRTHLYKASGEPSPLAVHAETEPVEFAADTPAVFGTGSEEVERILALDAEPLDSVAILKLGVGSSEKKARSNFRELSRLIHPDKCKHEMAGRAFDFAKKALARFAENPAASFDQLTYKEAVAALQKEHHQEHGSLDSFSLKSADAKKLLSAKYYAIIEERKRKLRKVHGLRRRNAEFVADVEGKATFELLAERAALRADKRVLKERANQWRQFRQAAPR